jgi:hypothetical protein
MLLALFFSFFPWSSPSADEGGASFWVPGQYAASLAAIPSQPGWSLPTVVYYYSGRAPSSAKQSDAVAPGTSSQTTQVIFSPTYVPRTTLLEGRLAISLSIGIGNNETKVDDAVPPSPGSQTVWGLTDMVPTVTLGWEHGMDSWMAYLTGNIPVGSYDKECPSNVGIGHAAIDAGGLYTYDNPMDGRSVSVALGSTYNFENDSTDYKNGIDSHLGLSAMQSLSAIWRVGFSGYLYYQLTGDSGSGNSCGQCKSRVTGIGPQVNYTFTIAGQDWSANLRGYYEFWAQNRLEGYALLLTIGIPLGSQTK